MKKFGLIGKTLSYSFSKNYFSEKFLLLGIEDVCTYENFELKSIDDFSSLIKNDPTLSGLNVTIPYKEQIIPFLDEIDPVAKEIGAVNTIRVERNPGGKTTLKGFNTDVIGFRNSILPLLNETHKGAMILGTGGASKAIEWSLKKMKFDVVTVSRKSDKNFIHYSSLNKVLIEKYPVIINTTPLGTFPETDLAPEIPYHFLSAKNLLFDLVYNPAETKFMTLGKTQGASVSNGLEMLKIQAEEAWKIWNTP